MKFKIYVIMIAQVEVKVITESGKYALSEIKGLKEETYIKGELDDRSNIFRFKWNDMEILSSLSMEMWAKFSDAANYRKKLDEVYYELLKIKEQLKAIDCKTAIDFEIVSKLIYRIEMFYDIGTFPTWEDYERFASEIDRLHENLTKEIEKEENN